MPTSTILRPAAVAANLPATPPLVTFTIPHRRNLNHQGNLAGLVCAIIYSRSAVCPQQSAEGPCCGPTDSRMVMRKCSIETIPDCPACYCSLSRLHARSMPDLILLRDTTPRIPAPLLDRTWAEVGLKEYYFKILLYALPDCQKWDDAHSLEH